MPRLYGGPYQALDPVAHAVPVKGHDGTSGVAIAVGDTIFWTASDTPKISRRVSGAAVGRALQPVPAGEVRSIPIYLFW